jgi:hypothetical protein
LQGGAKNQASTSQVANPLSNGWNGSLIAQGGYDNHAVVAQATGIQPMIGSNLQATVQLGAANSATTLQTTGTGVSNASVTAQFGYHNTAIVVQH